VSPANFQRCVPSDMKMKGIGESPNLSIDSSSVSASSLSDISPYLRLPSPVHSMNLGIEACRWRIAVRVTPRGVIKKLGVGWLPHQPSHGIDDVPTPVVDWALVIVIPSHILGSVQFLLPESLIIGHASHELLDAIPVFEAWATQSGVSFLQHIVIVRLHALLLDPTLDIVVLFMCGKHVVGIVM